MSTSNSRSATQEVYGQHDVASLGSRLKSWMLLLRTRFGWAARPIQLAVTIRVLLFVTGEVGARLLNPVGFPGAFNIWVRKDTNWYIAIASQGYIYQRGLPLSANFFPLYPLAMRIVQPLTGLFLRNNSYLVAGMLISWLAFIVACVLLFRLVANRFGEQTAYLSVLLLAVFPFSFFFGVTYTESLYFLWVLVAFTGIERGNWWLAGAGALLAGATHSTGLIVGFAVVVAYVVDWIRTRHQLRWDILALALVPLGTAAFAIYCWIHFGTPFAYLIAGKEGWHAGIQMSNIDNVVRTLAHPHLWFHGARGELVNLIYIILVAGFLIACYPVYRLLGPAYLAFCVPDILACMIDHPGLEGYGRYLSVVFPVFIVLAYYLRDRPRLLEMTIIGSTLLLALSLTSFTTGYLS